MRWALPLLLVSGCLRTVLLDWMLLPAALCSAGAAGCTLPLRGHRVCLAAGQGCLLSSLRKQGCRTGDTGGYAQQLYRDTHLLSCPRRTAERASWLVQPTDWGPKSGRTVHQTPWTDGATSLAQKMGRATSWDLCLGTATSRNAVGQDPSAGCCKPHPIFSTFI